MAVVLVYLVAPVLGWLTGSIPNGFLVCYYGFGVNPLKIGSGGIGETNVVRALETVMPKPKAKKWGFAIQLVDQAKGCIPMLVAMNLDRLLVMMHRQPLRMSSDQIALLGVGLILGHCYSAYLKLRGGKAVATTMGIALALNWHLAIICYAVWFLVKKILAKQTAEAVALASVRAAILLGMFSTVSIHDYYYLALIEFGVVHIIFAHRHNLKRYREEQKEKATKTKKRKIGGDMPTGVFISDAASNDPETVKRLLMQKKKFAWLIRPLPAKFVMNYVLPILPMKRLKMSETVLEGKDGKKVRVIVWGYPDIPKRMMRNPDKAVARLVKLVRYLEKIGADKICLGANTAVVGDKGKTIQESVAIPVTNGNRLTSGMAVTGALKLAEMMGLDLSQSTATVVGPGGSVGDGVCRMLLKAGIGRLLIVGSSPGKQKEQAEELSKAFGGAKVEECSLQAALEQSQIAVFASSATSRELKHELCPSKLPPGLIVVDMERPRGVSKDLAEIPWLLPNDGTMVAIKSTGKAGLGLPLGVYFPCFSELALMLLRGWSNKWCYPATLSELEGVLAAALDEGLKVASFRLNEQPLTDEDIAERIERAQEETKRRGAAA